ncbi:MIGA2 protein, partial [Alcedo cyanopectus]|nr:MIGA2 protein [Ceyx cyanopectus]
MVAVNSSSPTPAAAGMWEAQALGDAGAIGDASAESLYVQGMELFEEALQKWEQALTIRQRDSASTSTPVPWDSKKQQESMSENISEEESQKREFAEKLESLLHRAYHLQEEFGSSLPSDSMLLDLEKTLMLPLTDGSLRLRTDDEDSSASEDSFFSAAELFDSLHFGEIPFHLSKPVAAYEEALQLVKEGKVACRTLRTELLGCYSDQDFLAKLHCVRQAFQELLEDESNQLFFGEVGKQMVIGLMTKAEKNPKAFLESYEEMLHYALKQETWPTTQQELEGRGVVFNPIPQPAGATGFASREGIKGVGSCILLSHSSSVLDTCMSFPGLVWRLEIVYKNCLLVPDGFISHFYSVSEHVSPVLAFGFLGPKQQLSEVCSFFKHQIVQYLKDMFDLDNVRYTSVQSLAEDILQLSRRRSEILLGYLGTEASPAVNGMLPGDSEPLKELI